MDRSRAMAARSCRARRPALITFAAALAMLLPPAAAAAQATPDTLRLHELQARASSRDPRGAQPGLLAEQAALRIRSLDRERLPSVSLDARGQYQSDVAGLPVPLPGGVQVPHPPLDSYDASLGIGQTILDPSRAGRREVERARLAESESRVRTSLYALRQEVNEAFFAAMLAQAQRAEVEAAVVGLEERLRVATERVRLGSALPGEAMTLEAELARRRQSMADLGAGRDAALSVLGELSGRPIASADVMVPPELAATVAAARAAMDTIRARPEFEQLERSRALLGAQEGVAVAGRLPSVSAFGRAGYGRPGLNPLSARFTEYWLAGVQLRWSPWDWGAQSREREVLAVQQRVLDTESEALADRLRRAVASDLATMDRMEAAAAEDDAIVALRERILVETRLRFDEGVVTSAEYVDRETDLLTARLARAAHRVQLAQARARFLTTLGLEVR